MGKSSKKDSLVAKGSSGSIGLPPGWTRYTILIKTENLEKLKAFAFWNRIPVKYVLNKVIEKFLSKREINPIPKEDLTEALINQVFEEIKQE